MSDNFKFDIAGAPLRQSLAIALLYQKSVKGWSVDKDGKRLILYWLDSKKMTPLPAPITELDAIVAFVDAWLKSLDYGQEPDVEEVGRGSRVYNESWGQINNDYQAFVAIEPHWLMYGK